jgi:hypothetical protein
MTSIIIKKIIKDPLEAISSLTNDELEEVITTQNIKIEKLENKLNIIELKSIYNKYVIAIQDFNSLEKLETKLQKNDKMNIIKLKKNRIAECHYINNDDDQELSNDKITILLNKLTTMDIQIKNMFDKKYPNLIDSILPFIKSNNTLLSQDNLDIINDWWD